MPKGTQRMAASNHQERQTHFFKRGRHTSSRETERHTNATLRSYSLKHTNQSRARTMALIQCQRARIKRLHPATPHPSTCFNARGHAVCFSVLQGHSSTPEGTHEMAASNPQERQSDTPTPHSLAHPHHNLTALLIECLYRVAQTHSMPYVARHCSQQSH